MGYIEIDEERCKGCELCVGACPRQLITLSRRINHLGYHPAEFDGTDRGDDPHADPHPVDMPDGMSTHLTKGEGARKKGCTGCVVCGLVCPDTAISVYR